MAKYKGREVSVSRIDTPAHNEFTVHSTDYNGIKVKRHELIFTPDEKAAFLKQDEEAYKVNPDSYNTQPDVVVDTAKLSAEERAKKEAALNSKYEAPKHPQYATTPVKEVTPTPVSHKTADLVKAKTEAKTPFKWSAH